MSCFEFQSPTSVELFFSFPLVCKFILDLRYGADPTPHQQFTWALLDLLLCRQSEREGEKRGTVGRLPFVWRCLPLSTCCYRAEHDRQHRFSCIHLNIFRRFYRAQIHWTPLPEIWNKSFLVPSRPRLCAVKFNETNERRKANGEKREKSISCAGPRAEANNDRACDEWSKAHASNGIDAWN